MAVNETVGINLVADTKSLRSQLREATQELAKLQDTAGASAQEIANAAKRAAELKDRIGDAKDTIDAFSPDAKFRAFSTSIQGVAGAFAGAQGAIALFGVESENVQKQLLKVQSALALSEGINSIFGSIDAFKNLGLVIKTNVTAGLASMRASAVSAFATMRASAIAAFTTLRGALIASGIGAFVIALGLIITNFDAIKNAVFRLFPNFEKFTKYVGTIVDKFTDLVGITDRAEESLNRYSKASARKTEALEGEIKVLEAAGASEETLFQKRKEIINRELDVLRQTLKVKGKLSDEELKKFRELKTDLAVLETKYNKSVRDEAKKASDKQDEDRKKRAKEASDEAERRRKENQAEIDASIKQFEEEQHRKYEIYEAAEKKLYDERIKNAVKLDSGEEVIRKRSEKNQMLRMEKIQKQIFDYKATEVKITELTEESKLSIISNAVGAAANLIGRNTLAGKALAIAQATIDTYAGASKALATYPPPFGAIAAGTVIAGGLANVSAIVNTQVPQFAGGGASNISSSAQAPIAPKFTPPAPTALDSASLNTISNVVARAYVVESDITGSQKRIKRIENAARI
jgi:DNA repair exonuclease SbcCD ATPase subunit